MSTGKHGRSQEVNGRPETRPTRRSEVGWGWGWGWGLRPAFPAPLCPNMEHPWSPRILTPTSLQSQSQRAGIVDEA